MNLYNPKKTAANPDSFINLILASCESPLMKAQIMKILELESLDRISLINALLSHLNQLGAPTQLKEAIACLKDESVVQKTKELMSPENFSS